MVEGGRSALLALIRMALGSSQEKVLHEYPYVLQAPQNTNSCKTKCISGASVSSPANQ